MNGASLNCIGGERERSGSRVVIHEKWGRATPDLLGSGRGHIPEPNRQEKDTFEVRARWMRYSLRGCQIISSYALASNWLIVGVLS